MSNGFIAVYCSKDACYSFQKNSELKVMLEGVFDLLGMDRLRSHSRDWNPLQDNLIKPGSKVLIKPNMVLDKNQGEGGTDCLYTNPSLVDAVIPFVWKALEGKGSIIVADAPVQSCDFDNLIITSGYKEIIEKWKQAGVKIELEDLRGLVSYFEDGYMKSKTTNVNNVVVDLKNYSEHARLSNKEINKMRITNYNPDELANHHNVHKHEYMIAKDVLDADVIINMPKPKSHRKAGVTIGLKNFVGINVRKEYLPHHRQGDITKGGDEYRSGSFLLEWSSLILDFVNRQRDKKNYKIARLATLVSRVLSGFDKRFISKESLREGSWYGNDTIWRTIIDINKIIKYADKHGNMTTSQQRRIFTIADMIVVGEKEGPLLPSPKYAGIIAAGRDLVCFDEAIATLMGFDVRKIPLYRHIRNVSDFTIAEDELKPVIVSNVYKWNNISLDQLNSTNTLMIEPSLGWKGNIELE